MKLMRQDFLSLQIFNYKNKVTLSHFPPFALFSLKPKPSINPLPNSQFLFPFNCNGRASTWCWVSPTDEILIGYYLRNKNSEEVQNFRCSDLINELNLYEYDPFELPYTSLYYTIDNRRQLYCFTAKVDGHKRHCRTRFWWKKGVFQDITGAGNVVLGTKTLFVFLSWKFPQHCYQN